MSRESGSSAKSPYLLIQSNLVDIDSDTAVLEETRKAMGNHHYVLSPLCVAAPLEKNKASIYGMFLIG